jgi:hypothetical protein
MVKEIQILDVKAIKISEVFVSDHNTWRELTITTEKGEVTIDLYANDQDEDFLKIEI